MRKPQTLEPCGGQNNGVETLGFKLFKSSADIPTQRADLGMGEPLFDLRLTPETRSANAGRGRQGIQRRKLQGNQGITGVFSLQNYRKMQTLWKFCWNILHGVHGDIGSPFQKPMLQLFDKEAFTTHLGQGRIQNLVAARYHLDQLHPKSGMKCLETVRHMFSLP